MKKNIIDDAAPVIDIKPAAPGKPQAKRQITQVSKWEEPVIEETIIEETAPMPEFNPVLFDDDENPALENTLDDFLDNSSAGYTLRIYRLPSLSKNYVRGINSTRREFCEAVALTPDYLQYIKETWGAGSYQLELRDENNKIVRRRPVSIAAPLIDRGPAAVRSAVENPAAAPADPFAEIERVFGLMKKFQMIGAMQNPAPAPVEEMTPERALLTLASANDDLVKRAADSLTGLLFRDGERPSEPSLTEIIFEAVKRDTLPRMVSEIVAAFRPGPAIINTAAPDDYTAFKAPADEAAPVMIAPAPEMILLSEIVRLCSFQAAPPAVASFVDSFVSQHGNIKPYVDMFISMPLADAKSFLKTAIPAAETVLNLPHVDAWIATLQTELDAIYPLENENNEPAANL